MREKKKKIIYVCIIIIFLSICALFYNNLASEKTDGRILHFKEDTKQALLLPEKTTYEKIETLETVIQEQSQEMDNLITEFEEVFISMDFSELCNQLYASYYGSMGDEFIAIYDTFTAFICTQKNKESIPKYDRYKNNTEVLYDMGQILLEIENSLDKQNFDKTYGLFLDLYKEYSQYERGVFVSE